MRSNVNKAVDVTFLFIMMFILTLLCNYQNMSTVMLWHSKSQTSLFCHTNIALVNFYPWYGIYYTTIRYDHTQSKWLSLCTSKRIWKDSVQYFSQIANKYWNKKLSSWQEWLNLFLYMLNLSDLSCDKNQRKGGVRTRWGHPFMFSQVIADLSRWWIMCVKLK